MRYLLLIAFAAFISTVCISCSTSSVSDGFSTECTLSNSVQNPDGKLHGEPCENDDECMFGLCHYSPAVASFKFCTKRCDCGENSTCSNENGNDNRYTCQRFSPKVHPDETFLNICTRECQGSTCPAGYNDCGTVTGPVKVCKEIQK